MPQQKNHSYDVIVVGSGASGGWACKRLAEAGLKVALLEAGRPQSDKNFTEHKPEFELKYRNRAPEIVRKTRPIQVKFGVCNEYTFNWFVNDLEEPYTTPAGKPFDWMGRLRMTGGRTNVWGRVSLRFSDWDFKAASFDGYGENWPLGYKDIEPYYDLVEKYVGITGSAEGLEHLPDGQFQPPVPLTCQETLFRNRLKEKLGRTVMPARSANLTKPINGRGPCHFCGPCERGCMTHSYFNSAFTTVADALNTGNCTLISNAMVYKVLMDPGRNRPRGILYIDRNTRQGREIYARTVILCAQSQESVRILLNSATPQYSNGLANSSGVLGHYLTAHVRSGGGSGEFPALAQDLLSAGPLSRWASISRVSATCRTLRPTKNSCAALATRASHRRNSTGRCPASAKPTKKVFSSPAPASASPASAKSYRAGTISLNLTPASKILTEFPSSKSTCPTAKTSAP